eukprot:5974506-Amphidinium_carterae.1
MGREKDPCSIAPLAILRWTLKCLLVLASCTLLEMYDGLLHSATQVNTATQIVNVSFAATCRA